MSIKQFRRSAWLLPLLVLSSPVLLPLSARHRLNLPEPIEPGDRSEFTAVIYRIIANEWQMRGKMQSLSPRVETYLQYYKPDPEFGDVATNDDYFLGRLKFSQTADSKVTENSFIPDAGADWVRFGRGMLMSHIQMDQFAVEPLVVDEKNFDRKHYSFHPVRWEYLGDVRCLAIDIQPRDLNARGAFVGRIWVEDHDYAIVRPGGSRTKE